MRYKEKLDLNEKQRGYLCGLFAADGTLSKRYKGTLVLGLSIKDEELIRSVWEMLIDNPYTPCYSKTKEMVTIAAHLPNMRKFMESIGITPAKTYTLDVNLTEQSQCFILYFLRGLLDGDGSVNADDNLAECSIRYVTASLVFAQTLQNLIGGSISKHNTKEVWTLSFKSNTALFLASRLPLDDFCLSRKTVKLKKILKSIPTKYKSTRNKCFGALWELEEAKSFPELHKESKSTLTSTGVRKRLKRGMSMEEALTSPKAEKSLYYGKYSSHKGEKCGYSTFFYRISTGIPFEEAISTSKIKRRSLG